MDKAAAARNTPQARLRVRAAQYLRMSTDRQAYSIENQRDAIRDYAVLMGYDIVATYEDPGRSGLNIEGRPAPRQLLADVEIGQADFETVVVYDVGRWGRFQNIDESASYEYRCQRAGVRIEFCAEQFANDGSVGSDVLKAIKRSMAAELSRTLSQKVFIGQTRVVKMGFRGGGHAGFGLRRPLVDESGTPKAILGSRKFSNGPGYPRAGAGEGDCNRPMDIQAIFEGKSRSRNRISIERARNSHGSRSSMDQSFCAYDPDQ